MNKKNLTILLVALVTVTFASCKRDESITIPDDIANGVTINGIRWATRNVGTPGEFASAPESMGNHFQWNRRTADWVQNWNGNNATEWERENDPCPPGWRVPNETELRSLESAIYRWVEVNGVYGRLFGARPNLLFLPATGWRSQNNGVLDASSVGMHGRYWSSVVPAEINAMTLNFNPGGSTVDSNSRAFGFSVRCVAD